MTDNIQNMLDYTLLQMMSEGYWESYKTLLNGTYTEAEKHDLFIKNARYGNTRNRVTNVIDTPNSTKITQSQAEYLYSKYEIVDYTGNDNTGFAGLVFKEKGTNIYTISIRSTEYVEGFRSDALGADLEIGSSGFAYGQINSLDYYYNELKTGVGTNPSIIPSNAVINVTGYSLGGHLAHALYLLHPSEINHVYLNNSPGTGRIGKTSSGATIGNNATLYKQAFNEMMSEFKSLHNPETFRRNILGFYSGDINTLIRMIGYMSFGSTNTNG